MTAKIHLVSLPKDLQRTHNFPAASDTDTDFGSLTGDISPFHFTTAVEPNSPLKIRQTYRPKILPPSTAEYLHADAINTRLLVQQKVFGRQLTVIQNALLDNIIRLQLMAKTPIEIRIAIENSMRIEEQIANRPLTLQEMTDLREAVANDLNTAGNLRMRRIRDQSI
jgi:hypothetical protein